VLPARNTGRRDRATALPAHHAHPVSGLSADSTSDIARRLGETAATRFAAEVAQHIEGGRAGVLRPVARRHLMRSAAASGLRPFDATLIIAMVQDRARRGEPLARSANDPRLAVIPAPPRRSTLPALATTAATLALTAVLVSGALTWLAGG
jgi:hypothetical protein